MPNYRESQVSGSIWTRANKAILDNPFGGVPGVTFLEEQVVGLPDGKSIAQSSSACSEQFSTANATTPFDLIHPVTGAVIGQATYQQVYVMMASLYTHVAAKRDAEVAAREAARAAALALAAANGVAPIAPV